MAAEPPAPSNLSGSKPFRSEADGHGLDDSPSERRLEISVELVSHASNCVMVFRMVPRQATRWLELFSHDLPLSALPIRPTQTSAIVRCWTTSMKKHRVGIILNDLVCSRYIHDTVQVLKSENDIELILILEELRGRSWSKPGNEFWQCSALDLLNY